MKKKAIAILLATTMAMGAMISFTGCGDKKPATTSKEETVQEFTGTKIIRDTNGKVKTLNPHTYTANAESAMMTCISDSFFQTALNDTKDGYKFIPSLAKEMPKISDDQKTYTITLRDNIKFGDGTKIDAETYMYSFKMLLDPKLKNYRANNAFSGIYIVNAENYFNGKCKWEDVGIKKLDDKTLQFTFEIVKPELNTIQGLMSLGTDLVEPSLYEKGMNKDRTETIYGTSMETTPSFGPYKLTEWQFDQSFKVEKNKDSGSAMFDIFTPDQMEFRVVEEDSTVLQLFENKEVDSANVTANSYEKYSEDPRMYMSNTGSVSELAFNTKSETQPILKDVNFRKAIFYASNREKLAKDVIKTDTPAPFILSPYFSNFIDGKAVPYRDTEAAKAILPKNNGFDEKLAKELFDKAYAANGNKKITLVVQYNQAYETIKAVAESNKNDMEKLFGSDKIEFKLQGVPNQVKYENVRKHDFDMSYVGWVGGDAFDAVGKMEVYTSTWGSKADTFENKEFDELYQRCAKGDLCLKGKEKVEALAKMEKMILDEVPFVPLTETKTLTLYSDKLKIQAKRWIPLLGYSPWESKFTR